jgi:hypothetical protein
MKKKRGGRASKHIRLRVYIYIFSMWDANLLIFMDELKLL